MRSATLIGAAAVVAIACTGCASTLGAAAGNVVGGAAWATMKSSKLAFRGGKYAAKTTGRAAVGAVRGVNEEFSRPSEPRPASTADSGSQPTQLSQSDTAAPY